jgi:hypothetical protein
LNAARPALFDPKWYLCGATAYTQFAAKERWKYDFARGDVGV